MKNVSDQNMKKYPTLRLSIFNVHKLFLHRPFSGKYDNFLTLLNHRWRFHYWDHDRSIFKLRYRLFTILKTSIFGIYEFLN